MRLIDADEAIARIDAKLTEMSTFTESEYGIMGYRNACVAFKRMLDSLPTVNEWIPCCKRLPDNDGRSYLLNVIVPYSKYTVIVACNASDVVDAYKNGWINAWMPAPEPYVPEPHKGE